MALPLTITGVEYALRCTMQPPFLSSGGNVYVVGRWSSDTTQLSAWKATDPTTSFTEQDTANRPDMTNTMMVISAVQVGDVIHIATQESTTARVGYHTFNMATDAWGVKNEAVVTPATAPAAQGCAIAVRSDGDVIILYNGSRENVSGTNYDRVMYARRESAVWTTNVAVSATGVAANHRACMAVLGDSDRVHFFWMDITNADAYHRSLTSANSLNTAAAFDTSAGGNSHSIGNAVAYTENGTPKIRAVYLGGSGQSGVIKFDDADNPTISIDANVSGVATRVTSGTGVHAVARATNGGLWLVYGDSSTQDFFSDVSVVDGTWGTDQERRDAQTLALLSANAYLRGTQWVVAVTWSNGTSIVYDEFDAVIPGALVQGVAQTPARATAVYAPAGADVRGEAQVLPSNARMLYHAGAGGAGMSQVYGNNASLMARIVGASEVPPPTADVDSRGAQYLLYVDSERAADYAAPIDNLSPYVLGIRWRIGLSDAFEEVATPARMTVQLDNKGDEFFPDTLGAELLTNGSFAAWTGDNPTGWTVGGESGSDPEVSEVGASETHGGTGTGAANLYSSLSANLTLSQNVLTVNQRYQLTLVISAQAAGAVRLYSGGVALSPLLQAPDTYVYTFTARATDVTLLTAGAVDVTLDSVSVKAVALYAGVFEIGTLARFGVAWDGVYYPLFQGKVSSFDFVPGVYGEKIAEVTVEDQFWQLLNADFLPELETDVTTDTALRQPFERGVVVYPYRENYWCLDAVGSSELDDTTVLFGDSEAETALAFDTGYTSIEYVGDNLERQLNTSVQGFIRDVTAAEAGGRFYFDAVAGKYTFHNRGHDALNLTPDATLTNDDFESASYTRGKDIVNAVTINYEPRVAGTAGEVLWTAGDVPFLVEGYSQRRITFRYQDPDDASARIGGMDFINPVADVDYSANDASDGSDDNRKRSCVVTVFFGAAGADMTISNVASNPFYITLLRVRGTPLRAYERRQVEATAATSMARFERRERVLDIASMNDPAFAQNYADFLVNRFAQPQTRLARARFVADKTDARRLNALSLGIGSRIAYTDAQTGHSGDYLIVGAEHAFTPGGSERPYAGTHDVLWILAPANRTQYWRMSDGVDFTDVSVLDETTRLML